MNKKTNRGYTAGFTVVEIIVAIALITLLSGLGLWTSMDVYRSYSYRSEKNSLISSLQKARLEAMVNLNESKHGVHIESDKYTIFQGDSYGDYPALNRVINPSGAITIFGNPALPRDIVFDELSGATVSVGTITIGDGVRSAIISINNEGQISW